MHIGRTLVKTKKRIFIRLFWVYLAGDERTLGSTVVRIVK